LDLRMACLDERRRALAATTELFSHADAKAVEHAVAATAALGDVNACGDVQALRGPIHTAASANDRQRLADLRGQLAEASARFGVGRLEDAQARARDILAQARTLRDRALEADALVLMGMIQHRQGNKQAEQTLKQAVIAAEAGRAERTAAQAWIELVTTQDDHAVENMAAADESGLHANAYLSRIADDRLRFDLSSAMAKLERDEGKWDDAKREAASALAAARRAFGEESPVVSAALALQGKTAGGDEGIALTRRALAMNEKLLGAEHPRTADTVFALAAALVGPVGSAQNDESAVLFRRGIRTYERSYGPDSPSVAWGCSRLSDVLGDRGRPGDFEEAVALQERATAIYRTQNPKGRDVGNTLALLAGIYIANKKFQLGLARLGEAEAILVPVLGKTSPYVGWLVYRLRGHALAGLKQWDGAVAAYEATLATHLKAETEAEVEVDLLEALSERRRAGDLERARELAGKARAALAKQSGEWSAADVARIDA
jgi:hypothetical protein